MAEIGKDISKALELLKDGQLVGMPTETVYGLAADALNPLAVAQIFEAKKRPSFDPLIIHLSNLNQIDDYAKEVPELFYKLAEKLSPGPITYILKKQEIIPDLVTSGHNTVGIRIPSHPMAQDLLKAFKGPIAAPSANPFGYISPTSAQHVQDQLGNELTYILDGGDCQVGLESTILDLSSDSLKILRLGGMSKEEIENAAGQKIDSVETSSSNPKAPGMLLAHYAPKKKLIFKDSLDNFPSANADRIGSISFKDLWSGIPEQQQFVLSPSGDLKEAAAKLFASMRQLDQMDIDMIIVEKFPEEGLGMAINDRLLRASHS